MTMKGQQLNILIYILANCDYEGSNISKHFDIYTCQGKMYDQVHLVKHCQTLCVVSTFTGQNEVTVFDW